MKTVLATFAVIVSALAQDVPVPFGVMSTRSGSPIHLLPLTAYGGKFYLGGRAPSAYCPPELPAGTCPSGNSTVFQGGHQTLGLDVIVPGGQQVYIGPDGSMSYTVPHSVFKPNGSVVDGWTKTEGANFGNLSWKNGLIACPTTGDGNGYQVFGQLEGLTFAPECLGFSDITVNSTGAGAWEY